MIIENALKKDLADILDLQKEAFTEEAKIYNDYDIPPLKETKDMIEKDFREKTFLISRENDKITGCVRAKMVGKTCYIGRLCVLSSFQNRGFGSILMREIEARFKAERYELFTGEKSVKNIYLYKKLGYRIFKTKKESDNVNFVFMEKISDK